MDSYGRKRRKGLLSSRSIASEIPRACPSEAQARRSPIETHSWTVTQSEKPEESNEKRLSQQEYCARGIWELMPDQHQLTEPREQDSGWTVAKGLTGKVLKMNEEPDWWRRVLGNPVEWDRGDQIQFWRQLTKWKASRRSWRRSPSAMNQVEDADVEVHRKGIHKLLPPPLSAQVESDPCGPCSPCCRAPSQRKLESSRPLRRSLWIIHGIPDAATQRGRKQSGGGGKKEEGGEGRKGEKVKEGEGRGQEGKGGGGQGGHAGISQTI